MSFLELCEKENYLTIDYLFKSFYSGPGIPAIKLENIDFIHISQAYKDGRIINHDANPEECESFFILGDPEDCLYYVLDGVNDILKKIINYKDVWSDNIHDEISKLGPTEALKLRVDRIAEGLCRMMHKKKNVYLHSLLDQIFIYHLPKSKEHKEALISAEYYKKKGNKSKSNSALQRITRSFRIKNLYKTACEIKKLVNIHTLALTSMQKHHNVLLSYLSNSFDIDFSGLPVSQVFYSGNVFAMDVYTKYRDRIDIPIQPYEFDDALYASLKINNYEMFSIAIQNTISFECGISCDNFKITDVRIQESLKELGVHKCSICEKDISVHY